MKRIRLFILAIPAVLGACQSGGNRETIATLRDRKIEIKEETIHGGLQKAMESYQRFLADTPESALTPEAMRRLADLKIEKEYGYLTDPAVPAGKRAATKLSLPAQRAQSPKVAAVRPSDVPQPVPGESQSDFEKRATGSPQLSADQGNTGELSAAASDGRENRGAREALTVYKKLLDKYPHYKGNDQLLYQMSRAYDELGQTEDAMAVMDRLVREFPGSRYSDEVPFRRAEFFFTRRRYLDAEDAAQVTSWPGGSVLLITNLPYTSSVGPITSRNFMKTHCLASLRCWITRWPKGTISPKPRTILPASVWMTPSVSSA